MPALSTQVERARQRADLARLKLVAARDKRRLAVINGSWDAVKPNKMRRRPVVERKDEGGILTQSKRLKACGIGRDLERNYSPAKSILHQMRVNVVGSLGKIQINCEGGKKAGKWFNSVWAKSPDYRNDDHFSTLLQNIVASVIREGDCLIVVDDGGIDGNGEILTWESDQIVPLSAKCLAESQYAHCTQDNGILRNEWGKEVAYVVSGKRGLTEIESLDDCTIWPREVARLVRNPWRLNQGRGTPSILTPSTQWQDLYEILAAELASAKRASQIAGYTKRKDAVTDWDNPGGKPEFLPENMGNDAETVAEQADNGTDSTASNYERFESLTGGYWEYLDEGDEVGVLDINRPTSHLPEWISSVMNMGGASLGLARCYTLLQASTSYTAYRGEMLMSWATFYSLQKWLERTVCDWVAVKVLEVAMAKGWIDPLTEGWQQSISWTWPTMPEVDAWKQAKAVEQAIRNGTITYSALLGPDWESKFTQLAKELGVARDKLLPLAVLQTISGQQVDTPNHKKTTQKDKG